MKLSNIIPCYNVENFVQNCTESILMQQGFDFELIMINDGSKDNTLQVLENLAEKDFRIKVINQQNQGLSGARNTGIENATGEYIMFIDADDWLEPNAFELILDKFNQEDLFCFSYNRVFENKVLPRDLKINGNHIASSIQRRIIGLIDAELSDPSQADSLVTVWGKLYKTEIIKKNKIEFIDNKWFLGINKLRYKYDYTIALDNDATITLYFIQANKEYSIFIDWFSKTLFILDNNKRSKKVFL